ncbi:hypothetical protein TrRE_jg10528 [Triparma retinervis]|uniref:Uncharacterized protein n=1 Tax=Triparma retinervis TaxID=2557542 RepID=A0A9W7DRI6_9STRA|nr:hypothetical protein TrRE_jg10528 [Triparma retinervis]
MYIGPWQEYQLANKVQSNHVPPRIPYAHGGAIRRQPMDYVGGGGGGNGMGQGGGYSGGMGETGRGDVEGVIVGKDMVDSLKQQVDYLARLLEEQGSGGGGGGGGVAQQHGGRAGLPLTISRPANDVAGGSSDQSTSVFSNSSSVRRRHQKQRGTRRGKGSGRGGKNNSAVGYSRILSSIPRQQQQVTHIDLNQINYNKPPMSARSHNSVNSEFSLNSRYSYSHSEPGGGGRGGGDGASTMGAAAKSGSSKVRNMAASMREMSHSAPTEEVGSGFAMGGASQSSATSKKMYGGGYNKNLAARMLKVNRTAREGGFTKLGDGGRNDNIKNMFGFHTKALVGRSEGGGVAEGEGKVGVIHGKGRKGSVEMVKEMHKLYMSGVVDGKEGDGETTPEGRRGKGEAAVLQPSASPPGGGGMAAARSLREKENEEQQEEVGVVQDMDLTKQEFSQVSKYFGIDLEELEDDLGLGLGDAAAAAATAIAITAADAHTDVAGEVLSKRERW